MAQLGARCDLDVLIEQDVDAHLPPLSDAERKLWQLDFRINARGFQIDRPFAEAASKIIKEAGPELDAELARITAGEITSPGQAKRLLPWLQARGYRGHSLEREVAERQLARKDSTDPVARRALEIRLDGALASAKKVQALLSRAGDDDRVRGAFQHHKASTGRWSGEGFQPQNMKRISIEDIDAAIAGILTGSYQRMKKLYPKPLAVIGGLVRAMIIGDHLVGADFNAIEPRALALVAGDNRLLDPSQSMMQPGELKTTSITNSAVSFFVFHHTKSRRISDGSPKQHSWHFNTWAASLRGAASWGTSSAMMRCCASGINGARSTLRS